MSMDERIFMACGWYSRKIFPRLLNWSMTQTAFAPLREALLKEARGHILEIGFGTGANIPYYPPGIESVTAIDPNPGMVSFVQSSSQKPVPVRWVMAFAECLPFMEATFDTIVSTMTLCSVPQIQVSLQELLRVVRPGGQFLFLEHGQSPDGGVQKWQNGLTPLWKRIGDGCHLNRPMARLIQAESWTIPALETFYLPGIPKPFGYFYKGRAVKSL